MSTKNNDYTTNDVLAILDGDKSDFSEGGYTDWSEDDSMSCGDKSWSLAEAGFQNEPVLSGNEDDGCNCNGEDPEVYNSAEDIPLTARLVNNKNRSVQYIWKKKTFEPQSDKFQGKTVTATDPIGLSEIPLQYFKRFITDKMLEHIVEHTNRYSTLKHGRCANASLKEMEQLLGMYFKMGLAEMPSYKMYWENGTRYPAVADIMSRNRFKLLLGTIHFVDNEIVTDDEKKNKLWKVQLFLEMFRMQCLQVIPIQHQSIDEMMIPYKGKFGNIRQYVKGKPHPWGFKVWCRCSPSGLLHDFEVYQGRVEGRKKSEYGVGGSAVLKLCETLEKHAQYKIYADNFFTSIKLIEKLSADGFLYAGTVRQNCLGKALKSKLLPEKDLSRNGRGSYDVRVESTRSIVCLRWLDTRAVTMLSNYAGAEPMLELTKLVVGIKVLKHTFQ